MMGRLDHDQEELFYSFRLDGAVPDDHPVRKIAAVLDLSWGRHRMPTRALISGWCYIQPAKRHRQLEGDVFAFPGPHQAAAVFGKKSGSGRFLVLLKQQMNLRF
jgi:hypothetical protein